jgi:hypothetical protein
VWNLEIASSRNIYYFLEGWIMDPTQLGCSRKQNKDNSLLCQLAVQFSLDMFV